MYQVSVYWAHGKSAWSGQLDERELTYQVAVPWLWLARYIARAQLGNRGNLAYSIHTESALVEERKP